MLDGAVVVLRSDVGVHQRDRQVVEVGGGVPEGPHVHRAVQQRDQQHHRDRRAGDRLAEEALQLSAV